MKSNLNRWSIIPQALRLAIVLALTAIVVPPPSQAQEEPGPPEQVEMDWQERIEERSVYTKTLINDEGNDVIEMAPGPLHYQEPGSEEWLDIDTTLQWDNGWSNTTNSFPIHLPQSLGGGEAIEFGPEYGVAWVPGTLGARLTSGAIVVLAEPLVSYGYQPDETASTILYPELYPGVDLHATVAAGEVFMVAEINSWDFDLLEEEIDRLFIDAGLFTVPEMMEQVDQRLGGGESVDRVPIYFGRADAEYSIAIVRDPGLDPHTVEDALSAIQRREEVPEDPQAEALAAAWTSPLGEWLQTASLRFFMPTPNLESMNATGSTSSALTAAFKIKASSSLRTHELFSSANVPAGSKKSENTFSDENRWQRVIAIDVLVTEKTHYGKIMAGRKADGGNYRSRVVFHGIDSLKPLIKKGDANEMGKIWLGYNASTAKTPAGVTAYSPRWVVSTNFPATDPTRVWDLSVPNGADAGAYFEYGDKRPYNSTDAVGRTGIWGGASWNVGPTVWTRYLDGSVYNFGEMWRRNDLYWYVSTAAHGIDTKARGNIELALKDGDTWFSFPLRNPYDNMVCVECTQDPSLPLSVRGSSGNLDVGMELTDVRLMVEKVTASTNEAMISATTAGNGPETIYPGGSRDYQIKLDSISGGATKVRLSNGWPNASTGLKTDYYRGNQWVQTPELSPANNTLTLRVSWPRASSSIYNKSGYKLPPISVSFDTFPYSGTVSNTGTTVAAGRSSFELPLVPRAPEATLTLSGASGGVMQTDTSQNAVSLAVFSAQSFTGAQWVELKVEALPGSPMNVLKKGTHWFSDMESANSSNGGLVAIPSSMKAGLYSLKITPCLKPAGLPAALHCLDNLAWTDQLNIAQATPSGPLSIDWLEPWSAGSGSGASTLKVHGGNLGGATSTVTVGSPVTRTGSVSGTDTLLNAPLNAISSSACGPVPVTVTRTDGASASTVFNVVKPFRSGAANAVLEAEVADFDPTQMSKVTDGAASNGFAMTKLASAAGSRGKLVYTLRVPATSSDWQLYLMAAPSQPGKRHFTRVVVRDDAGTQLTNYVWAETLNGSYAMKNTYKQGGTPGSSKLSLQSGKTYTVVLSNEPVAGAFPKVDMLVLSAGTLPPLKSEVCR